MLWGPSWQVQRSRGESGEWQTDSPKGSSLYSLIHRAVISYAVSPPLWTEPQPWHESPTADRVPAIMSLHHYRQSPTSHELPTTKSQQPWVPHYKKILAAMSPAAAVPHDVCIPLNHEPKQIFPHLYCLQSGILTQKWKSKLYIHVCIHRECVHVIKQNM